VPSLSSCRVGEIGGRGGEGLATPVRGGGEGAAEEERRHWSGEGRGGGEAPPVGEGPSGRWSSRSGEGVIRVRVLMDLESI
jgi:hypothetical protein